MEIEAKFIVPTRNVFEHLRQTTQIGPYRLSVEVRQVVTDRYVDTKDRRLLAEGYACRYREQADGVVVALKGLGSSQGGIHRRVELESRLSAELSPEDWPSTETRERVLAIIGQAALELLFGLPQIRLKRQVYLGEQAVAEWSLDEVRLSFMGHEADYFELEIEQLPTGTEADLVAMVDDLRSQWQLEPEPRSKFERALALYDTLTSAAATSAQAHDAGVSSTDTMAEAAHKILRFYLRQVLQTEAGTREGHVEGLHDMRVAVRRMHTALRAFKDILGQEQIDPYRAAMRQVVRILGKVRDLDVFWEKTEAYLNTVAPEDRDQLALLKISWARHHKVVRMTLLDYLDSADYRDFIAGFGRFLTKPVDEMMANRLVREALPALVQKRLTKVLSYDNVVNAFSLSPTKFHRLRIACKRLRYALESFETGLGSTAAELIAEVKAIQDYLGELQDGVVAGEILKSYLMWGDWDQAAVRLADEPIIDPATARYLAWQQAECRRLLESFPQVWRRFKEGGFQDKLAICFERL